MSKKTIKIITILSIIMCIIMAVTPVFAEITPDQIQPVDGDTNGILTISGKVVGFIRNVGIAASVIILMIIGFKYLTGSVEEKADYKKSLMPYVVGAIVLFGASSIAGFVVNFMK